MLQLTPKTLQSVHIREVSLRQINYFKLFICKYTLQTTVWI